MDGLCVPREYMYINESLCEYEPDDYDGTEEDKKQDAINEHDM